MPDPFPSELVEAAAKALAAIDWTERGALDALLAADPMPLREFEARAVLAAVLPLIEQRVSRDAYPQAWRYGAAEENARIVAALRAKGTHAADVLADQIEMEAP